MTATTAYRAATQSITYDEATTYLVFLRGSFADVFTHYNASNHVLFSALARISIGLFGVSELTLRLPTVVAAAGFFAAAGLVCRRAFGPGGLSVIAAVMVVLNPYVLDFMCAARGYGLALALLTAAVYGLTLALDGASSQLSRRWGIASLALGLSVCAQPVFAIPAVALAVSAAIEAGHGLWRRPTGAHAWRALASLTLPGAAAVALILGIPLWHVRAGMFSFGARRASQSVLSLIEPVVAHNTPRWACVPGAADPRLILAGGVVVGAAAVLIAAVGVWLAVDTARAARQPVPPALPRFARLTGGALLLTIAEMVLLHHVFGVRYPQGRTGLYLLLLLPLAASGAVAVLLQGGARARILGRAGVVVLALASLWFAREFNLTRFYEWRFDAGTRRIVDIVLDQAARDQRTLRVWADDILPSVRFYQVVRGTRAMEPLPDEAARADASYDFFIACSSADLAEASRIATPVYGDAESGAVLLRRRP